MDLPVLTCVQQVLIMMCGCIRLTAVTKILNFTIPVGTTGDYYDRFLVRNEEMWQSLSIIEQAYQKVQEFKGAEAEVFHADVPAYYLA